MNRHVHYELTRVWALDEGLEPAVAEAVADADWAVDNVHHVSVWSNKGYHFAWFGARRRARRLLADAILRSDPVALGEALHCVQDAIGHGFWGHIVHWRGIDRWEHRGLRVRTAIERESRAMMRDYRDASA